jgi:serine protease AprX
VRSIRLLAAGALVASAAVVPAVQAGPARPAAVGRYIVQLAPGERAPLLGAHLERLGVTAAVAFDSIHSLAITAPRSAVESLLADGVITAARAERKIELHLASSVPYIGADHRTLSKPAKVGKYTRPAVDGRGQTVAVLDTGIWDVHPDLQGRVTKHMNFEFSYVPGMLLSSAEVDAYAEATGATSITDDIGHGTHVAGIVGGSGAYSRNRANANRGVAPGAKLVDLRIAAGPVQGLYDDAGWERNAIAAFEWLLRHSQDKEFGPNGIRLSTNSWGLTGTDVVFGAPEYEPLGGVITQLHQKSIITVFSAGNDGAGDDVTDKTVPNGLPQVISVAASCKPDATTQDCSVEGNDIAKFSSRGPSVDIAAPGVEIVSTVNPSVVGGLGKACAPSELGPVPCAAGAPGVYGGTNASEGDVAVNYALYGSLNGTSMAGPHIAGVVALLLQANPRLTPTQVQTVLAGTASDRQRRGRDIEAGWGLVNVQRALVAAVRLKSEPVSKVFPTLRWRSSL